jgi:hypothetical protein
MSADAASAAQRRPRRPRRNTAQRQARHRGGERSVRENALPRPRPARSLRSPPQHCVSRRALRARQGAQGLSAAARRASARAAAAASGRRRRRAAPMSALFDFRSFLTVVLLTICTCTYVKMRAPQVRPVRCTAAAARRAAARAARPLTRQRCCDARVSGRIASLRLTRLRGPPQLMDPHRTGFRGMLWKMARCGCHRCGFRLRLVLHAAAPQ